MLPSGLMSIRMLLGLMSLCKTPTEWAAATGSATPATISNLAASGTRSNPPSEFAQSARLPCGAYSPSRKYGGLSSRTSYSRTMSARSPSDSRRRRKSVSSRLKLRRRSGSKQNLKTRCCFVVWCIASQTSPKVPSPSFRSRFHPTRCGIQGSTSSPDASRASLLFRGDGTLNTLVAQRRRKRRHALGADLKHLDRRVVPLELVLPARSRLGLPPSASGNGADELAGIVESDGVRRICPPRPSDVIRAAKSAATPTIFARPPS